MLLNLDEAKYMHEEYEHLLSHLLAVRCQRRERAAAHQPVQRWQTLPSGK